MNQIIHDNLPFILGRSPMKAMLWVSAWTFVAFTVLLSASEISYAPLPKIVKDAAWIIKGKILSANRKDTPDANRVEYAVAPTTVLMGLPDVPQKVMLSYAEYNPVIKDDQGKPVGWASPIYSGSGKEFSVKADEEWIFLFVANQLSGTDATSILRVEPVSQDAEIRSILAMADQTNAVSSVPVLSLDPFSTRIEKRWIGKNLKDVLQGKIPDKIVILYTRASAAGKGWQAGRIQEMWQSDIILVEKAKLEHEQPMPGLSALVILKDGGVLRFELWQKCGILTSPEGYAEFDMKE